MERSLLSVAKLVVPLIGNLAVVERVLSSGVLLAVNQVQRCSFPLNPLLLSFQVFLCRCTLAFLLLSLDIWVQLCFCCLHVFSVRALAASVHGCKYLRVHFEILRRFSSFKALVSQLNFAATYFCCLFVISCRFVLMFGKKALLMFTSSLCSWLGCFGSGVYRIVLRVYNAVLLCVMEGFLRRYFPLKTLVILMSPHKMHQLSIPPLFLSALATLDLVV
jgi:hypothetical protein